MFSISPKKHDSGAPVEQQFQEEKTEKRTFLSNCQKKTKSKLTSAGVTDVRENGRNMLEVNRPRVADRNCDDEEY